MESKSVTLPLQEEMPLPHTQHISPHVYTEGEDQYNPMNVSLPMKGITLKENINNKDLTLNEFKKIIAETIRKLINALQNIEDNYSGEKKTKDFLITSVQKINQFIWSLSPIESLFESPLGKKQGGGGGGGLNKRTKGHTPHFKGTQRNVKGGMFEWVRQQIRQRNLHLKKQKQDRDKKIRDLQEEINHNQCIDYDELDKCTKVPYYLRNRNNCRLKYDAAKPYLTPTKNRPAIELQCDSQFIHFRGYLVQILSPLNSFILRYASFESELDLWVKPIQKLFAIISKTNQANLETQLQKIGSFHAPEVGKATTQPRTGGSIAKRNKRYKKKTRRLIRSRVGRERKMHRHHE